MLQELSRGGRHAKAAISWFRKLRLKEDALACSDLSQAAYKCWWSS